MNPRGNEGCRELNDQPKFGHGGRRNHLLAKGTSFIADLSLLWPVLADRGPAFACMVLVGLVSSVLEVAAVGLTSSVLYLSLAAPAAHPAAMLHRLLPLEFDQRRPAPPLVVVRLPLSSPFCSAWPPLRFTQSWLRR